LIIRDANNTTARANIDEALQITADVFFNALSHRRDSLLSTVRALSSDYAFKPAAHTNEHQTVLSTLESYQERASADVMLLLSLNGNIIADTQHPLITQSPFYIPSLVEQAMNSEYGEADSIDFIDQKPYILVIVPLFSPEPSHWIVMGFLLTDDFALDLQQTTKSQVSLLFTKKSKTFEEQQTPSPTTPSINTKFWQQLASTLPTEQRDYSQRVLASKPWHFDQNFDLILANKQYVSVVQLVKESESGFYIALLQRSLTQALRPYKRLHVVVASMFFIALAVLIIMSHFMARKITKPVLILAKGAKEIEQGHYNFTIDVGQHDELGQLANRFNAMAKGLAERVKVRSLLGKVVSPAIAEQLINKGVELGGEERKTTVLFSDIRDFTQLCEQQSAKSTIILLNQLLTRLSKVIDKHQGVIDKYIGDAMMALFGAPITDQHQAANAVLAALAMQKELNLINKEFAEKRMAQITIGIGINSATVIAGNMGSSTRLNYTVIGDGVNISSRLEGLTKFYGVPILVSEATKMQCSHLEFQEIDTVRVKGKQQGLTIYLPLGDAKLISYKQQQTNKRFNQALKHYKNQQWQLSLNFLEQLVADNPSVIYYQIYQTRVTKMLEQPNDESWDGIYTHLKK